MTGLGDHVLHGALLIVGGAIWHFLKALMDHLAEREVRILSRLFKRKQQAPPDDHFV